MEKMFLKWASKMCPDGKYINTASTAQIQVTSIMTRLLYCI